MSDLYARVAEERANHEQVFNRPSADRITLKFPVDISQTDERTIELIFPVNSMSCSPFSEAFIEGLMKQLGTGPAEAWLDKQTKRMAIDLVLAQVR